jgi:hypothetical protein
MLHYTLHTIQESSRNPQTPGVTTRNQLTVNFASDASSQAAQAELIAWLTAYVPKTG